ncbi:hypothetical protein OIU76_022416 [Salix suchowensis]|nr:hypothetical protein OIU76_022416 [Salix suchowensis]
MLDGKAVEEKEAAAKALSLLVLHAGNRSIFRKTEGGIVSTVQLLDPSIQNLDKKYPVSILASILNSKRCRKQMIAAGAAVHLKKLMEMDVEGSKKLLDGLGRGPSLDIILRCAWNLNLEDGSLIDPGEKRLHFPYNILLWSSINILPEQILKLDTGLFIDVCGYGPAFILGSDPTPSTRVDANLNG